MSPDRGEQGVSPTSVYPLRQQHDAEGVFGAGHPNAAPSFPAAFGYSNDPMPKTSKATHGDPQATAPDSIYASSPHRRRSSQRSNSIHSSSSSQSRRDSGYSSSKTHRKPGQRPSRASSKQSLRSGPDTSISDKSLKRPRTARAASYSRMQQPARPQVEDARTLHERSLKLFPSHPQTPAAEQESFAMLQRTLSSPQPHPTSSFRPVPPPRIYTAPPATMESSLELQGSDESKSDEEYVPATIMHWTSDETRRKEYAKIDKSSKGVRGLWTKLFPFFACGTRTRFYDEKQGSRAGSIRRYRLDMPDEDDVPHRRTG